MTSLKCKFWEWYAAQRVIEAERMTQRGEGRFLSMRKEELYLELFRALPKAQHGTLLDLEANSTDYWGIVMHNAYLMGVNDGMNFIKEELPCII